MLARRAPHVTCFTGPFQPADGRKEVKEQIVFPRVWSAQPDGGGVGTLWDTLGLRTVLDNAAERYWG
eukprot:1177849-Prorocentrum_minimum.AAC.2